MSDNTKKQTGFTIVELLIVIVVIGILAAIVIVAYNGVQEKARVASVKSDLANIARQYGMFQALNNGYPQTPADLESLDVSVNKDSYMIAPQTTHNLVTCYSASDANQYAVAAITKAGTRLYTTHNGAVNEYSGSTNWAGTNLYSAICTSILPGSTFISNGSGYGNGWRAWTSS